jgi:AraC-like DNA-binding protein
MSQVKFKHYIPKPPLSQFVGVFWYWEGYDLQEGKERCLPSGTTELVVSLQDLKPSGAVICGARSDSFILDRTEEDCLFGIHFNPGGAFPFLGVPACELEGLGITLDDLWPGEGERIRNQLFEATLIEAKFQVMENWLLSKLRLPLVRHPAVQYALSALSKQNETKLSEMSNEVGLSQRRFIQVFKNQVGLAPKLFSRVMRFQEIINSVGHENEINWADVALANGYFDQAHFNHDFKEFSGLTPTDYMSRRTGHLNHVRI